VSDDIWHWLCLANDDERVLTNEGTNAMERYDALKQMLISRQRELLEQLRGRMRSVRDEAPLQDRTVPNPGDAEVVAQTDLELALIQMKAETANKIDEALVRLEEGRYGLCFECGERIAESRLRALPFAVRCKDCEEAIETEQQRDRVRARRVSSALGFELFV
jgi:DnaK suppressor protein